MSAHDMEPTISDLISQLQHPSLDLFEDQRLRDEIAKQGADAARELLNFLPQNPVLSERLLRTILDSLRDDAARNRIRNDLEARIEPNHDSSVRRVCMRLAALYFQNASHIGSRLLDFANTGADETRIDAIKAAAKFQPTSILGNRMVGLLGSTETGVVVEVLNGLPRYDNLLEPKDVVGKLVALVESPAMSEIRCSAIELLGRFGDIDIFERICLQPLTHERERLAVQVMVGHLLAKPRNVLALAPKTFELLVKQLLQKMDYDNVEAQSKGSWDDGVDVTAWTMENRVGGPTKVKMIAQCKRYSPTKYVGADVITKMVDSMKSQQAAKGLIITTSSFQPAAIEMRRMHQYVELIDGQQLQILMDTHFEGTFRIGNSGTS